MFELKEKSDAENLKYLNVASASLLLLTGLLLI